MRVLVTGGSGFVGGALVEFLVGRGDEVRATVRSAPPAARVVELGAEPIAAELFEHETMVAAMTGCHLVYHVAGVNSMCQRDPGAMYDVNVNGPRAVVRAAAAANVGRVVLTSSAAAIGEGRGTLADESTPSTGSFPSHYARSKHLGEQAFFDAAEHFDIAGVAVSPSSVQGPGRVGGSARLLLYALRARRPVAMDVVISLVDIQDVSHGHVLAAERGRAGSRYLLSGTSLPVRTAFAMLEEAKGEPIAPIVLPPVLARAVWPLAWAGNLTGAELPVCPEMLRTLLHGHRFDGSKATRELGLVYTPPSETFRRTVAWYRNEGLLTG